MIYIAWALIEIANVVVFGLLAWHFDKWWIILFALLLSNSINVSDKK